MKNMAMEYQNFASLGVNLNRQKYGPLDISNVFTSYDDLTYYITKGTHKENVSEYWLKVVPYPYEGQVLATVIDGDVRVYVLSLNTDGAFITTELLKETLVDDKTIKVNSDGKLSIAGLDTVEAGKTYVPSLVNGAIVWAEPDNSITDDLSDEIDALDKRVEGIEKTLGDSTTGLVKSVADNATAISDEATARQGADAEILAKIGTVSEDKTVVELINDALATAKKYADDNDSDTVYDDTNVKNRIQAIENDYLKAKDKYDDTALANRVKAIEDDYLKAEDKYDDTALDNRVTSLETAAPTYATKTALQAEEQRATLAEQALDTRLDKIEEFFQTAEGKTLNTALDTLIEIQEYIDDHGEVAEQVLANKNAIATLNGDATTVGSVDKKIADATEPLATKDALDEVRETANAAAVATEVTAKLAQKVDATTYNADKETFALKATVEEALGKKANADDVVAKSDFNTFKTANTKAIEDAAAGAVSEVEAKGYAVATEVADTYATKQSVEDAVAEIDTALNDYAKSADVASELAKKIESATIAHTNGTNSEGATVEGTTLKVVIDAFTKQETLTKIAEVADLVTALDGSLGKYKTANDARVGAVETKNGEQDTAIANAQARADKGVADAAKVASDLATANLNIAENARQIGVLDDKITNVTTTLTEKVTALEGKDTTIEADITALKTTVNGHTSSITDHTTRIGALENKDTELAGLIQANTDKFNQYATTDAVNTAIQEAIQDADLDTYAKVDALESIYKVGDDGAATGVLADEITRATAAEQANADAIGILVGADTDKSVRTIAAEETAKIVAGADEKYDTLKEIADFIASDTEGAAKMSNDIAALKSKVDTGDKTVTGYVTDYVSGEVGKIVTPKASTEVTVATDGTLGIGTLSTDKIVNGTEILVLYGGSSTQ